MRLLLMAAIWAAFSLPAAARQQPCGPHGQILRTLAERWGESPAGMGIVANGFVVEFVTNARSGSFTVVLTQPGGVTCVVMAGENWEGWRVSRKPETGRGNTPQITP
ncbi:MAG: hypothetical protein IID33_03170 [Planctomycetes bacterium]|nr:hypothetical protein [Planctomycetota bacterium]